MSKEKVVWLYVNHFEPFVDADKYGEHPKAGRVYRAIYNEEHDVYKVAFYDEYKDEEDLNDAIVGGVIVHDLKNKSATWEHDFTEINKDNLDKFTIEPEDYLKIKDWSDNPELGIEGLITGGEELTNAKKEALKDIEEDIVRKEPLPPELEALYKELLLQEPQEEAPSQLTYNEEWNSITKKDKDLASAYRSIIRPMSESLTCDANGKTISLIESILNANSEPVAASQALVTKELLGYAESYDKDHLYSAILILVNLLKINNTI